MFFRYSRNRDTDSQKLGLDEVPEFLFFLSFKQSQCSKKVKSFVNDNVLATVACNLCLHDILSIPCI